MMMVPVSISLGKVPKIPNGMHIMSGGVKLYIKDGFKHRLVGPAEINTRTGTEKWFKKGLLHREHGPAVTDPVKKIREYWINGKLIKKEKI